MTFEQAVIEAVKHLRRYGQEVTIPRVHEYLTIRGWTISYERLSYLFDRG